MQLIAMPEAIDGHVDRFRTDGVTVLRGLLDHEWLALLAEGVEHNRRHPSAWSHWYTSEEEAVGFWSDYVTWPEVEPYRRIAFESGLAEVAGRLMGSDEVRFFHEHVLVKEPGATERTPWHHDQPYYCLDGDQTVSMWIPLDPVPDDTALRFVAGSHGWDRWFVPRRFVDQSPYADDPGPRYEQIPDVDALLADPDSGWRTIVADAEPGDVVAFHFRTVHGAPGNPLGHRRRAVSLRWVGGDARWAARPWDVSPPYEPDGRRVGDPLGDDPRFPVVDTRPTGSHG